MVLDDILDLPTQNNPKEKVRDRIARILNGFLERGEMSSYTECAIFQFRTPMQRITSKTEDLIKCLIVENINFPSFEAEHIKNDADFRYLIINGEKKFKLWKQYNE